MKTDRILEKVYREVWGLESVLLNVDGASASSSSFADRHGEDVEFVGFVVAPNLSEEAQELLQKMLSATKLSEAQIRVTSSFAEAQAWNYWMALTPAPASFQAGGFWLESFGPQVLVKSPELKRKTWEDIQKLLSRFNSRRSLSAAGLQGEDPSDRASI